MNQLSYRLETIVKMVKPCESAADIGTDHGFVPIALIKNEIVKKAYACDIGKGPLERAKEHVGEEGLEAQIDLYLGDGLKALPDGVYPECVIIAGMGGLLMKRVLNEGRKWLKNCQQLILSPHTDRYEVRRWLTENGWSIDAEEALEDEEKYYEIFHAIREDDDLTDEELFFGPQLILNRPDAYLKHWKNQKKKQEELIGIVKRTGAKEKLQEKQDLVEKINRMIEREIDKSEDK